MSLTPTLHVAARHDPAAAVSPPAVGAATAARVTDALGQAAALSPWLGGDTGAPPSAAPNLATLSSDGALLADLIDRCAQRLGTDRRDVAAGLLFHDLAWRALAPALSAVVVADVAPRLSADAVVVVLDEGAASTAVHFTSGFGHVGDGSPAQRRALLRTVRDEAVDTLGPVISAIRPLARRGQPSLWGEVADTIASAMQAVGDLVGRAEACRAAADDLLDGSRPIRGGANWVDVEHAGLCCTWRVRNACCKAFALEQYDYCAGCPMLCGDEQRRGFEALNEAKAAALPA